MNTNPHLISLEEAINLTHAFQNSVEYQNKTIACKINAQAYSLLLNQPECVAIRTYFGLNAVGKVTIVVIGVNIQGNDISNGIILNFADLCPVNCNFTSPLIK